MDEGRTLVALLFKPSNTNRSVRDDTKIKVLFSCRKCPIQDHRLIFSWDVNLNFLLIALDTPYSRLSQPV